MSILTVNNLGKAYRSYRSEWHRFANWFGILMKPSQEHWVLRYLNFDIEPGEAVGIIGLNGAGKSTLLKMITGVLQPSEGQVLVNGRIAAILELGMGFNPELTGRQNVVHTASLMGFSIDQINQALPSIETFAEIGEYFDEPVRTYSSGMQMRIAFSVATGFRPDILIVDEAMAVGDAHFQQKCFHRIQEFKQGGGTLLFVSHDPGMIKTLCTRALLLDSGRLIKDDEPKVVMDLYQGLVSKLNDMGEKDLSVTQEYDGADIKRKATSITANGDADLIHFCLQNESEQTVLYLESQEILKVKYQIKLNKFFSRPAFGLIIRDKMGNSMFETSSYAMNMDQPSFEEGSIVNVCFTFKCNLKCGQYSFSVGVSNNGFARSEFEEISLLMHDVEQIHILESPSEIYYGGIFNMNPSLQINLLKEGK